MECEQGENKCVICGGASEVINSRPHVNGWYRRRKCLSCGDRWSTHEVRYDGSEIEASDELRKLKLKIFNPTRDLLLAVGFHLDITEEDIE